MTKLALNALATFLFLTLSGCGDSTQVHGYGPLGFAQPPTVTAAVGQRPNRELIANSTYVAIDAGGTSTVNWSADEYFSGGRSFTVSAAINTSAVTDPAPQSVYQTSRYAPKLVYAVPNLIANGTYAVRLHFAENFFASPGKRNFAIMINGTQVQASFDIFAASGGKDVAIVESYPAVANSSGTITVQLTATINNASLNGLELIANGSPQPSPTPSPNVTASPTVPIPADAFADSIGVDTHIPTYFSAPDWQTIVTRFAALGVRHVRDGILDSDNSYNAAVTQILSAGNAKLDGLTDCAGIQYYPGSATSAANIQQFNTAIGNRLEYVEAPNEVDGRNDPNWIADTLTCLPGLRGALPGIPFIGPSLDNQIADATALGNISSSVDFGNLHRYFLGRNPETIGWGATNNCGVYGNLQWAICEGRINAGSKPIFTTETGYNSQTEVDEVTQAKYLCRALLLNLVAGIPHTYVYAFKDYSPSDGFGGDGLLRMDDSVKPAYTAIANLYSVFSDLSAPINVPPIAYSLTHPELYNVLLAKRNSTYTLALWNGASAWNFNTMQRISVAQTTEMVSLNFTPYAVSAQSMTDTGALGPSSASVSGDTISVPVDDHITLVTFRSKP